MVALVEAMDGPMTEKKAVSKTVRISEEAYVLARRVAGVRGIDIGEYVSSVLLNVAQKDLKAEARKIIGPDK